MIRWGWIALGGIIGGMVISYCGIMCSHITAFRIQYNLRVRMTEQADAILKILIQNIC